MDGQMDTVFRCRLFQKDTEMCFEDMFWRDKSFVGFHFRDLETFSQSHFIKIFRQFFFKKVEEP